MLDRADICILLSLKEIVHITLTQICYKVRPSLSIWNNYETMIIHGPYAQKYSAKLFYVLWCYVEDVLKNALCYLIAQKNGLESTI